MEFYSPSRLSAFEQCPHRYKLIYVDHVEEGAVSVACLRGSAAHFGIERIYEMLREGETPTLAGILEATRQWWREQLAEAETVGGGDRSDDEYLAEAEQSIRNYFTQHHPFDADETVAIELRIEAELDPEHGVMGYVDRLARRAGRFEVHDYKTGRRKGDHADIFDNRQLALYAMGVANGSCAPSDVRLVWHYVQIGKTHEAMHSAEEYASLRRETLSLIARIEKERRFPRQRSWVCRWCNFQEVCGSRI